MARILLGRIICFTALFVICRCTYISTAPENITVQEGKTVTLPCDLPRRANRHLGSWYYSDEHSRPLKIYSIDKPYYFCKRNCKLNTTGATQFDFSLTNITKSTSGTYSCRFGNVKNSDLIRQYSIKVIPNNYATTKVPDELLTNPPPDSYFKQFVIYLLRKIINNISTQ